MKCQFSQKTSAIHFEQAFTQHIHICYHPDDKEIYSVVAHEIQRLIESNLFKHTTGNSCACFDLTSDVTKADLLIPIISPNSLKERNNVLHSPLSLAQENNFPIMPILIDGCTSEEINDVLDERHCLALNAEHRIDQVLSNRLEEYLSLYILNDPLIQKINNGAFRGKVFISYRRVDKVLVRPFLKRIQKDERFIDISFWWDECLTPGEVFTEELGEAISSSDAFLLCVTSNTFEEGNYILQSELPLARKNSIPIVPVILETEQQYPIPSEIGNENALYSETDALNHLADIIPIREYKEFFSPEKSYLLSRAYWMGISTEINYDLAVLLNEQAAKGGHKEAKRINAVMNKFGHGEMRNLENTLTWRIPKIEFLRKQAARAGQPQDALILCRELFAIVEPYLTSGNPYKDPGTTQVISSSQAVECLREIIQRCEPIYKHPIENSTATCMLILAYFKLANLLYKAYRFILRPGECSPQYEFSAAFMQEALELYSLKCK